MITEERVLDFIRSFGVDRGSEALHMIEKEAIRDDVPIIRKESGELLRILLQIKKPDKNLHFYPVPVLFQQLHQLFKKAF